MAITANVDVIATGLWPQGDIRDPLGIWGFRLGVTGDASGGSIKVGARVPLEETGKYIYTCYSQLIAILTQATQASALAKGRLLTNWPNIDPQAGVQGYATARFVLLNNDSDFTAPKNIPDAPIVDPQDRFLLLFDPRPSADQITIVEQEIGINILDDTYSFEGYGYFWDRSVLNAPGGPRHPGAS